MHKAASRSCTTTWSPSVIWHTHFGWIHCQILFLYRDTLRAKLSMCQERSWACVSLSHFFSWRVDQKHLPISNSCSHLFTSNCIQTHTCHKNTKFHSNVIGKYTNNRFHFHVSSLLYSVSACYFSWSHTYLYNHFLFLSHKSKNNTNVFCPLSFWFSALCAEGQVILSRRSVLPLPLCTYLL